MQCLFRRSHQPPQGIWGFQVTPHSLGWQFCTPRPPRATQLPFHSPHTLPLSITAPCWVSQHTPPPTWTAPRPAAGAGSRAPALRLAGSLGALPRLTDAASIFADTHHPQDWHRQADPVN